MIRSAQAVSGAALQIGTHVRMQLYPQTGIFMDEAMKARIGAMVLSLGGQAIGLLREESLAENEKIVTQRSFAAEHIGAPSLLRYLFARTTEWSYIQGMEQSELSPDLQRRIESQDGEISKTAMSALIAQSRFVTSVQNYHYPLAELPAELVYTVMQDTVRYLSRDTIAAKKEYKKRAKNILADFDENANRLSGQMKHAVMTFDEAELGDFATLNNVGVSQFFAAIAIHTSVNLDQIYILSAMPDRTAFATLLRAAGYGGGEILKLFELLTLTWHDFEEYGAAQLDGLDINVAQAIVSAWADDGESYPS